MEARGAYTAERAAALSGVPKSTVHYWARQGILVPSVSPVRVRLWSYGDLLALRTIYWLRQTKQDPSGREVPRTAMEAVRRALREIAALTLDLWSEDGAPCVAVDRAGGIVIEYNGGAQRLGGQNVLDADMLDLLAPFASSEGLHGPDLSTPRPRLRIVPGKLGGS
ncbi:MAG: MerR family transcriptional regulator, partial [Solirubrobacteraceae bacterium]